MLPYVCALTAPKPEGQVRHAQTVTSVTHLQTQTHASCVQSTHLQVALRGAAGAYADACSGAAAEVHSGAARRHRALLCLEAAGGATAAVHPGRWQTWRKLRPAWDGGLLHSLGAGLQNSVFGQQGLER